MGVGVGSCLAGVSCLVLSPAFPAMGSVLTPQLCALGQVPLPLCACPLNFPECEGHPCPTGA